MSTPVLVSKTETTINLSWTALTSPANGNSPVTSYNIYWDNASGTVNINLASGTFTSYTVTGLTGGLTYLFMVSAQNIYGAGSFSS
jgi:hypothetical protein